MPQAMLIDINTAAITHRNGTLSGITDRNYSKVIRHLYCYNAALPVEYKVRVDSDEYYAMIKSNMVAQCNHCTMTQTIKDKDITVPTEIDMGSIHIIRLRLRGLDRLILGQQYDNVWECPKCHKDNRQSETTFIKSKLQQPFYLRCVPEAPSKTIGMVDRTTYDAKFEKWASDFLEELEDAAAKFRQEYKPKDQSEFDENSLDLSMEDKE